MSSDLRGKAITVKGVVDPDELGITSMHEHLFLDMSASWGNSAAPSDAFGLMMSREPVKLENLWWIKRQPHANLDNTRFNDYKEALDEVSYFTREGGGTIVECSTRGLGRDPKLLRWVSNEARVHIVAGSGYYVAASHPPELKNKTVDQVAELLKRDVLEGIDGSGVRAGILGEIGTEGTPDLLLHPDEEKVLKAAAKVQRETGVAISVHPPRTQRLLAKGNPVASKIGHVILDLLEKEGADLGRVVMCHMDRSCYEEVETHMELVKRGAFIEYDLWGTDTYNIRFQDAFPNDMTRLFAVKKLLEGGYGDKLLFAHDICMKMQRVKYGGFGYGHILRNVVPMLKLEGISDEAIRKILVENPKQVLTFA